MTTQNSHDELEPSPADQGQTDPIGPITMPERSRADRRALALVGSTSLLAASVLAVSDSVTICSSISAPVTA
ncbi:hypothetical protein [Kribbella sp. CA-293567]|uniref:hypothetical protein n=1 Tax=Kribbella sp. CA-293567 TaxID=3002436 RepID=UPI0022DDB6EF|nr:hypothetical protein [Kribbella sp. CA-293567]WBQ06034.1 hypothetical protein OX958_04330 [Kribbella sp. CA-293567]